MWLRYVPFAIVGLSVLVWGIRPWQALPAPRRAALTGAILGALAILLGLVWWVWFVGLVDYPLPLFDNLLISVAVIMLGPVLAGVGLARSIKARGGAMKREVAAGLVLNLLALFILAVPVCLLLLLTTLAALDLPIQ